MKKLNILFTVLLLIGATVHLQAQDITDGLWYDEDKDAKIDIYKNDKGKYDGKIVWLREPNKDGKPKLDSKNKDKSLRSRQIKGIKLLTGFEKKGDRYVDGEIYDPKSGKTYSCKMTPEGKDKLKIRGYIGISLIGRTTIWTRAED